jgi:hypothetical protein
MLVAARGLASAHVILHRCAASSGPSASFSPFRRCTGLGAQLLVFLLASQVLGYVAEAARASSAPVRGVVCARARVLALPSSPQLATSEGRWLQQTQSRLQEKMRARRIDGRVGVANETWLRDLVRQRNEQERVFGDRARFDLIPSQEGRTFILQLEWTSN